MPSNKNALKQLSIGIALGVLLLASPLHCLAANAKQQLDELLQMDLTDLVNVKVVLPTRQSERQFDAPSAIYVITQEDIRRSGLTRIPEILRMVPGLHVGRLDNNTWSVSSRSDLLRLSNTMLVLMDGRTLYDPLFAGVYWDVQDTFIQDIDRIEIIRGPGGPLWGANAVDGIINIVTKSSQNTHGGVAYGGYGENERKYEAAFRYGTHLPNDTNARLYFKRAKTDQGEYLGANESTNKGYFNPGDPAHDDGNQNQAGFRVDWQMQSDSSLSLQGDVYKAQYDNVRTAPPRENTVDTNGHNLITKWSKNKPGYNLDFQFVYDHTERTDLVFEEHRNLFDLDFQHSQSIKSHLVTWGLGYRYNSDETMKTASGIFALDPENSSDQIYSAFVQDRIGFAEKRWFLTLGSKFEHNDFTGYEVQPTVRLLWKPTEEQSAWASISRAVHTPSRSALDGQLIFCEPPETPGCSQIISDPDTPSENVIASEAGYRSQLSTNTVIDMATFYNRYFDTLEDGGNIKTYGLEVFGKQIITPKWQMEFSYTYHRGTSKSNGMEGDNNLIPRNSANFRSLWNFNKAWEGDVFIYYTDGIGSTTLTIADYTRVDLRAGWNPIPAVKTSLSITNLFDDKHAEVVDLQRINTTVGRGMFLSGSYTFN